MRSVLQNPPGVPFLSSQAQLPALTRNPVSTRSARALSRLLLVSSFFLASCAGDSTSPSNDLGQRIVKLQSGVSASCALTASGSLKCWGQAFWDYDSILVSPSSIPGDLTVSDFSLGTDTYGTSACAVTEGLATY